MHPSPESLIPAPRSPGLTAPDRLVRTGAIASVIYISSTMIVASSAFPRT